MIYTPDGKPVGEKINAWKNDRKQGESFHIMLDRVKGKANKKKAAANDNQEEVTFEVGGFSYVTDMLQAQR